MKLDEVGTIIVRFSAVAFVLKAGLGLANLTTYYVNGHRAVVANPSLTQGFNQSLKIGLLSVFVTLVCGLIGWWLSRPLGRLLAKGLDSGTARPAGVTST